MSHEGGKLGVGFSEGVGLAAQGSEQRDGAPPQASGALRQSPDPAQLQRGSVNAGGRCYQAPSGTLRVSA